MPQQRENIKGRDEGDEVKRGHAANGVVDVGSCLLCGGNAEEVEVQRGADHEARDEQADHGQRGQ